MSCQRRRPVPVSKPGGAQQKAAEIAGPLPPGSPVIADFAGQVAGLFDASLIDGDNVSSLEPIRATRPELLIVDLRLQGADISGWDILQAARADPELGSLPVIVCSADVMELRERAEAMAAMPGVEVLRKPFALDELEELVRRLLA